MSSVEEAVRGSIQAYAEACNAGDLEAYKAVLAEDVEWHAPDQPTINGRDAVGEWVKGGFFDLFDVNLETEVDQVEVVNSKAYASGTFELHLAPKDGSSPSAVTGAFFNILKEANDGKWEYAYGIFNFDAPQS